MPKPSQLFHALLPAGYRCCLASGSAPWHVLPGLLLGIDAGDVWCRSGKHCIDGRVNWIDAGGEDISRRPASQSMVGDSPTAADGVVAGSSGLAAGCQWSLKLLVITQRPF
jgi:hypothetical protein